MDISELLQNIHLKGITSILESIEERVEGNLICDIQPNNWIYHKNISKIKNLQTVCKNKKNIIEIGVNACHSLLIMLLENPNANYILFDLNNHKYTMPCIQYIRQSFPNTNISVYYGDSVETLDKYIKENPEKLNIYDFCHIDGGHTEDIFSKDYEHIKQLISTDGIAIFDDYDYIDIKKFIDTKLQQNEITKYVDSNILDTNLHFIYKHV
jgi:predicted O-methyltransferase YrrM